MPLNYKLIGNNIKRLRKAQHVTQQKMADDLFISLSLVSKLERGVKAVSLDTFCSIADYLNSSIGELIADPNEPKVQHNHMITEINGILENMDNTHLHVLNELMHTYAAEIQVKYEFPDNTGTKPACNNPVTPA